jgi:predicted protein tyrosine phosphatase
MFIQNVSYNDITKGNHKDPGENAMLIQIVDPLYEFPLPAHQFKEMHQFEFADVDVPTDTAWEFRATRNQCESLVILLEKAYDKDMNVIVHCHAGVCRSGAVTEVGTIMGFEDTGAFRLPNVHVKRTMMEIMGHDQLYYEGLWQ